MANRRYNKPKHVRKFADKMRRRPVEHELMFLRRLALANVASFDYQVRMGFYVADFVFPTKMLIIELDGKTHDAEYDARRDGFLGRAGFTVWRIPNSKAALWPLSKIADYQRPDEGRNYIDAIRWANRQHDLATAVRKGKTPPPVPKGEDRWESYYSRLAAKTEAHHKREQKRLDSFKDRPIKIIKAS